MIKLKHLFTIILLLYATFVNADSFLVNGFYYVFSSSSSKTATVTYSPYGNADIYIGDLEIPETVTYNGTKYTVTAIGSDAFSKSSKLTKIAIPNTVTSIGQSAFSQCSALTTITIPSSVTSIGKGCFTSCTSLVTAILPNNITKIDNMFYNCQALENVTIPNNVTSIVNNAFYGCVALKSITLPNIKSIESYTFYNCSSLTGITIPATVTTINTAAFSGCKALKSITIPNSVVKIENFVFNGCTSLKEVNIEDGTSLLELGYAGYNDANSQSVGTGLFASCPLEKLYLGRDIKYNYEKVAGYSPFYDKKTLTSVTIGSSVTIIEYNCFSKCNSLTELVIPQSVTELKHWAFDGCTSLKKLYIQNSDTKLSVAYGSSNSGLFGSCPLEYLYLGRNLSYLTEYAYGYSPFNNKTSLKDLTISNNVTEIRENLFRSCSNFTSITIPASVTSIGDNAFYGCSALKYIYISDYTAWSKIKFGTNANPVVNNRTLYLNGNKITKVNKFSFITENGRNILFEYSGKDTNITLPENCNGESYSIGDNLFKNNTTITSITIPSAVTSIGTDAFYGCTSLKTVINKSNLTMSSGSGSNGYIAYYADKVVNASNGTASGDYIFSTENGKYILTAYVGNATQVILPEDYEGSSYTIGKNAFAGCSNIHSLTVSTKVEKIEEKAFEGCNIAKVIWLTNTPPEGYERLCGRINYVANNKYTALENVVIFQYLSSNFEINGTVFVPSNMQERKCCVIDYNVNNSLNNVVINEFVSYKGIDLQVEDVMPYSFYNNSTLGSLTLKNNGKIGKSAFNGCSSLLKLNIPVSITQVEDSAFANCAKLADVVIDDRTTILPLGVKLFDKSPLNSLYIGAKISYLSKASKDTSPFCGNTYLKSVVITDVESDIYDYEFYGCSGLESAVVGDGVERIGRWAFSGCSSLNDFVFGSNISTIGEEAFSDCTGITKITGRAVLPPVCGSQALEDINIFECKLYVPSINIDAYKNADQWKNLFFIEELVTNDNYVTYMIDGEVYKTLLLTPGKRIIAPYVADTSGKSFAGWDMSAYIQNTSAGNYPIMPDKDITINGSYNYTAIEEVVAEKENVDAIYNLNGLRVIDTVNLKSGIYIMNGKKVLVK